MPDTALLPAGASLQTRPEASSTTFLMYAAVADTTELYPLSGLGGPKSSFPSLTRLVPQARLGSVDDFPLRTEEAASQVLPACSMLGQAAVAQAMPDLPGGTLADMVASEARCALPEQAGLHCAWGQGG